MEALLYFKELSESGGRADFSTSAPLSLMTYQMSLISAGSIPLDSTFNAV
jgi:hypothetical protein